MPTIKKRTTRVRPRGRPRGLVPMCFPAGGQQYTVRVRINLEPTHPNNTDLYAGSYTINPYGLVALSFSSPLVLMFKRFRLNSYSLKVWASNVSQSTPGNFYSVLLRDSSTSPPITNNYLSWIYNQAGHRESRAWGIHRHSWRPVEAQDYNFADFAQETNYDFGTLYIGADSKQSGGVGVFYIDFVLNLTLLNRVAPSGSTVAPSGFEVL